MRCVIQVCEGLRILVKVNLDVLVYNYDLVSEFIWKVNWCL